MFLITLQVTWCDVSSLGFEADFTSHAGLGLIGQARTPPRPTRRPSAPQSRLSRHRRRRAAVPGPWARKVPTAGRHQGPAAAPLRSRHRSGPRLGPDAAPALRRRRPGRRPRRAGGRRPTRPNHHRESRELPAPRARGCRRRPHALHQRLSGPGAGALHRQAGRGAASSHARFGAVSFIHRFGASLNRHVHYHYASSTESSNRSRMPMMSRNPCAFAPPLT